MTARRIMLLGAVAAGVVGIGVAWDRFHIEPPALNAAQAADKAPAAPDKDKAPGDKAREADSGGSGAAVKNFIKVFEKGEAKALAALFTEEGEYIANDGATLRGRAAMENGYAQFFKKNPGMKLQVAVDSVRFVSQDNAVVEGSARSYKAGKPQDPTLSRISALYVREKGTWLLAMLREWPDNGETLADVDWLIGTWESKSDAADVRTTYEWEGGKNFILRSIHYQAEGQPRNPLRHAAHWSGSTDRPTALLAVRERRRLRRGRVDLGRQGVEPRFDRGRTGRRRGHGDQHPHAARPRTPSPGIRSTGP